MKFSDIQPFTTDGNYHIDVALCDVADTIRRYQEKYNLELNPDFQRGYVWTKDQKSKFVEYLLRGGISSDIRFNHPGWMGNFRGDFVCVDGLQRLTACIDFLENRVEAFGTLYQDFEGKLPITRGSLSIRINDLKTKKEVLQWYLELNTGGTVHTEEDLTKVKDLLENL